LQIVIQLYTSPMTNMEREREREREKEKEKEKEERYELKSPSQIVLCLFFL